MSLVRKQVFEDAELLLGQYYHLSISAREHAERYWLARATIRRRDTDEEVGGFQASGQDEGSALERLADLLTKLPLRFRSMPYEWQKLEVRGLLIDYKKSTEESTSQLVRLKTALDKGELTKDSLQAEFRALEERSIATSIEFSRRLGQLPRADLVELMGSAEDVYCNRTDPYNIDELYIRDRLFEYILQPAPEVIAAHNIHATRLREI